MKLHKLLLIISSIFLFSTVYATQSGAITSTIKTEQLQNFDKYPPVTKKLIKEGLDLTKLNLTYTYGSADPKNAGMDCSGTIYYLLQRMNVKDVARKAFTAGRTAQQK